MEQKAPATLIHSPRLPLDEASMPVFDTSANGAIRVEGAQPKERIDFASGGIIGGVFAQGPGKSEVIWPATEHGFVLEGEVTITDVSSGESVTYGPGDGWIIKQGTHILWEVKSERFVKSFLAVDDGHEVG